MEKANKKLQSNAKVVIDFQLNVTKIVDGQTVTNDHMDGKFSMEINEVRETIRTAVAGALKGAADVFDTEDDLSFEEEFSPDKFQD